MSKVQVNKRLLYFFFFIITIPVIVGVLAWDLAYESSGLSHRHDVSRQTKKNSRFQRNTLPHTVKVIGALPWLETRLPSYLIPVHYDITLYPDFDGTQATFYGNETVEIIVKNDTQFILLHANALKIKKVSVVDVKKNRSLKVRRWFLERENQYLVVKTRRTIPGGSVVHLALQFTGSLDSNAFGFFKSSYVNSETGQTTNFTMTDLEPIKARTVFPCMDEPSLKAQFTITAVHHTRYTALSNMPPVGPPTPLKGSSSSLVVTKFHRTVTMSTYLVCIIVCDFSYIEANSTIGKNVRMYAVADKVNQTRYALEIGLFILQEFERLLEIPYHLPKLDMIAIPDFGPEGMENWGLITFRESSLLFDPSRDSLVKKQQVAIVVAHEIAHQWFGNLVTMAWWNDLWLNEGFASIMSYYVIDAKETKWNMMSQFVVDANQRTMPMDGNEESIHPLVRPVKSIDEINKGFDVISYLKGASVLRMLEAIMGKENFLKGVVIYLKRYKWQNAKTQDLWQALSEVRGAPDVKKIMDTWTFQNGFPYINLTFNHQRTGIGTTTTARQKRFMNEPGDIIIKSRSPFEYKWYVSFDCRTTTKSTTTTVLDLKDARFHVNDDLQHDYLWVKCNLDQTGYYRVNYPPSNWMKFATTLKTTKAESWTLSAADRSGLLDDVINLARAGLRSYSIALEMISYLDREDSYFPWQSVCKFLNYIYSMLYLESDFTLWKYFVLNITTPVLRRLGWNDTGTDLDKRLRGILIDLACKHGDSKCLSIAASEFREWLDKGKNLPQNLKSHFYAWGMWAHENEDDWQMVWERYKSEMVPEQKTILLQALSNVRLPSLIIRLLEFAKEAKYIKKQDFTKVMHQVAVNPVGQNILWVWIGLNVESIMDRSGAKTNVASMVICILLTIYRLAVSDFQLGKVIPHVTSSFYTETAQNEVKEFFRKYPNAGNLGRKQALDNIRQNIYWVKHFKEKVAHIAWLENGSQVCLQARYPNYSNNSVQSLQTGSWTHLLPLALGRRFTSKISSNPAASKSK